MLRLDYTNLSKKQVEDILAKAGAPVCAANLCTRLAGKSLKIVLDKLPVEGPTLEYEFISDTRLALRENGATAVECGYGALTLKDMSLFSHMIPGTKTGYTVIINWKTSVVTAFEMWFIDHEGLTLDRTQRYYEMGELASIDPRTNREVQRQCYYGYVEQPGKTPPAERDKLTLRLENSMIEWREDREKHRLTTYVSSVCTTMVELDTPDGGDVITLTSDILQVSDPVYIHCFGEVEFSGRLSVEVFDLYSMKKIGVTMGIDENDAFEYTLYKGCGKYLGRYSSFFDFNDRGDQYSDGMRSRLASVKGARATYRPSLMTKLATPEDIEEASKKPLIFDEERRRSKAGVMSSSKEMPDSDYCVGKSLTFRGDDGFSAELRFKTISELEYRNGDESEWHTERYSASELDEDLIFLGFYRTGSNPPVNYIYAFDFKNGCATCVSSKMGSKYDPHDAMPSYHFGVIEMEGLTPMRIFRHGFTDELLGCAFTQTYSDDMSSIHIYNAPHSYSWTIINNEKPGSPANRAGGAVWSSPCEYLKLRDDMYLMVWVEQRWSGHMDVIFRNLRTGRDGGYAYGITYDGKTIYMDKLGAISRSAGSIDLKGLYPLRNFNTHS